VKVLVVGSGGREHALVWKLKESPRVKEIFCAPGNGGIAGIAACVDIKADDIAGLLKFAREHKIDLTVIGPEVPLVAGIVDTFEKAGLKAFGPSKAAAQLEGSKAFAKDFMARHHIPTAAYRLFDNLDAARRGLDGFTMPVVVKADGLAAGKGVVICSTRAEAEDALTHIMGERVFKEAGSRVVIEEFLDGEEASILAVADGRDFVILESSQDHKRVFDNDQGPNTGGMGAYSPAPVVTPALMQQIAREVIAPVIDGMRSEGAPFKGVLYAGIMVTAKGPKVLEFNTRFGDPETQAVLPRLKSDLCELMLASVEGRIKGVALAWDKGPCVCVVMAAGGYPGGYSTGKVITGLDQVAPDAVVFHAGTRYDGENSGPLVTAGGRVLGVVARGKDVREAVAHVYAGAAKIFFDGAHYRKDIGYRAIQREN
jgi:phosphoribosylamine---glycine ligase